MALTRCSEGLFAAWRCRRQGSRLPAPLLLRRRALGIPAVVCCRAGLASSKNRVSVVGLFFPHFKAARERSGSIAVQVALKWEFRQLEKLGTNTVYIRKFESGCFF